MTTWRPLLPRPHSLTNLCLEKTREATCCAGAEVSSFQAGRRQPFADRRGLAEHRASHPSPRSLIRKLPRGSGGREGWFRKAKEEGQKLVKVRGKPKTPTPFLLSQGETGQSHRWEKGTPPLTRERVLRRRGLPTSFSGNRLQTPGLNIVNAEPGGGRKERERETCNPPISFPDSLSPA